MRLIELDIAGAYVIELEAHKDNRGMFARGWCREEAAAYGLETEFAQTNIVTSWRAGTLRRLYFQAARHAEAKLVCCIRGAIYDMTVDLRAKSLIYGRWVGLEVSAENRLAIYVSAGCAHDYLTLADDTEVLYQSSVPYTPVAERGVRYDDPRFAIAWPHPVTLVSAKNRSWPDVVD